MKTLKLCVTGLCEGNSLVTGEFPAQRASNRENVSIRWRHHVTQILSPISIISSNVPHLLPTPAYRACRLHFRSNKLNSTCHPERDAKWTPNLERVEIFVMESYEQVLYIDSRDEATCMHLLMIILPSFQMTLLTYEGFKYLLSKCQGPDLNNTFTMM